MARHNFLDPDTGFVAHNSPPTLQFFKDGQ
jgi:hypothetical protein